MTNTLLDAAITLGDPANLLLLVVAVVGGAIVGAAPGLSSTMAIGLLVPLTFAMPKEPALILLLGIYCGGIYGGAITAVLLNLPGTPTAAVTAIDGYPMTQRGEGARAIALATIGSSLGGILSCVILIALSVPLSRVIVFFGSPEYFALGVFAATVVFALSGDSVLKGFVAICLGFLLATVGIDQTSMVPRFTFGISEILTGIPIIPAIIGLFCVSEVFRMAEMSVARPTFQASSSGLRTAFQALRGMWGTIVKSGTLGCVTGCLPGVGALTASYIAYAEAKRSSKNKAAFGRGAPEGVAASEAANNGVTGGALVPTLTFGIPGDTNTLMILSAFTIHGVTPGPVLFREDMEFVYVIFGALIAANVIILPTGLWLARYIAKAALVPRRFLLPAVAVLAITGASIGYGHVYFFWISIIFGILGWLLRRGGFPLLPVAMALILGPMIERELRSSLMLPDFGAHMLVDRPVMTLLLASALAVLTGRLSQVVRRRR